MPSEKWTKRELATIENTIALMGYTLRGVEARYHSNDYGDDLRARYVIRDAQGMIEIRRGWIQRSHDHKAHWSATPGLGWSDHSETVHRKGLKRYESEIRFYERMIAKLEKWGLPEAFRKPPVVSSDTSRG